MEDVEKSYKILLVEDDRSYRNIALQCLYGHERFVASNAKEGLKKFKDACPDITFLDISLPDGSGMDLLEEFLSYDPEAYIVMLTASRLKRDVELSEKKGAAGYVIKPFTNYKVQECLLIYEEYKAKLAQMTPEERQNKYQRKLFDRPPLVDDKNLKFLENEMAKRTEVEILKEWNVLFLDGFLKNRETARGFIKKVGCNVDIAGSEKEAVGLLESKHYQMLLLDTSSGGYEVSKYMRRKEGKKHLPAYILGMIEGVDEVENKIWLKAGMNDFLRKPINFITIKNSLIKYAGKYLEELNEPFVE